MCKKGELKASERLSAPKGQRELGILETRGINK